MSKRTKTPPIDSFSFLDFPPEVITYIGDSLKTGVARRKLSRGNKYLNAILQYTPKGRKIEELKETMLEYYDSKKFVPSINNESIFVDVHGSSVNIITYVHPTEGTNSFSFRVGAPVLPQSSLDYNDQVTLTLRPMEDLPEIVRTVIAFVFHAYYTAKTPLPPIIEINFTVFQENLLAGFRMTWTSFETFVNHNPYNILLNALTEMHKNLQYLNELPSTVAINCDVEYDDLYRDEIQHFNVENDVDLYDESSQYNYNVIVEFDFKFIRPSKTVKGSCFMDDAGNLNFIVYYKLSKQDFLHDAIVESKLEILTNEILKTTHMLLPNCIDYMGLKAVKTTLVSIKLKFPDSYYSEVPYYFTMEGNSYLCKDTYVFLYPYIEKWLRQAPRIFKNNLFHTFLIDSDLSIERKESNYFYFETLPEYASQ